MAGKADWEKLVSDIAATPSGPLAEEDVPSAEPTALPAAVQAYVDASRREIESLPRPFVPQVGFLEGMRAKPAKAHETDVFTAGRAGGVTEGPDFKALVQSAAAEGRQQYLQYKRALRKEGDVAEGEEDGDRPQWALEQRSWHRVVDFEPIIVVPSAGSSPIRMQNVRQFLEEGWFEDAADAVTHHSGTPCLAGELPEDHVEPRAFGSALDRFAVKFRRFRIVRNVQDIKGDEWDRVCAAFVVPGTWQFDRWYDGDRTRQQPSDVFLSVRGFLPYFEEDKVPKEVQKWRVVPLVFNRKDMKAHNFVRVAMSFWEELYTHLDSHEHFRKYTIEATDQ